MIDHLWHWAVHPAAAAAAVGATLLVQSTLLISAGLLAAACARQRSAAVRSAILRATLVAVIACPLAAWLLTRAGAEQFHIALPAISGYALPTALAIAIAGLLLVRLALAIGMVRGVRLSARSASVHWIDDAARCARTFGMTTPPVLQSDRFTTPCLVGFQRPVILLPTAAKIVRHDVLIHELAHLRRRDCLWHLLCHITRALLWFQPLMWLLTRRIEQSADEVCDDFVVAYGGDRAEYARALVDIAERHQMPWVGSASAVGMAGFKSNVSRRVVRIMDNTRTVSIDSRRMTLLMVLLLGIGATLLTALLVTSISPALADNAPAAGPRLAVPDAVAQAKKEKLIRDVFGNFAAAPLAERPALAAKLIDQGIATADDPAARYVLLKDGGDLAASAGDAATAMRAASLLAGMYAVDIGELKLSLLRRASNAATTPAVAAAVVSEGLNCANEAAAAGNYDLASRFMFSTEQAAHAAKDITLILSVQSRAADIKWLQQESTRAKTAEEKLNKSPTDPDANHTLGRYFCLVRGDWAHGLIGLSKGSNPAYHAAATADLAKPPTTEKQIAAGDLWWDLAEKETAGAAQRALRRRAGYWYSQAVANPQFAGLSRALVEKKLSQITPPGPGEAVAEVPRVAEPTAVPPPAVQPPAVTPPPVASGTRISPLTNSIGMKLVLIPAGEFMMGSPKDEKHRQPGPEDETLHHVTITKPFLMATTTVTQAQWKALMGSNPSYYRAAPEGTTTPRSLTFAGKEDNLPVEQTSWNDAVLFCEKLSAREGRHYRLPTEAEWEYACRAGTQTPFGDDSLDDVAWYAANSGKVTHEVATKKPNRWGLYDMIGNVWQWCSDGYGPYTGDAVDPQGSNDPSFRVNRGGSWVFDPANCRAAMRRKFNPGNRNSDVAFRVCLDTAELPAVASSLDLTTVQPTAVQVGIATLGVNQAPSFVDHLPKLNGKPAARYFFAHAPSKITFAAGSYAGKTFVAKGVVTHPGTHGVSFVVQADGKEIFRSKLAKHNEVIDIEARLPADARTLELIADPNGVSTSAWAFWTYPAIKDGASAQASVSAPADAGNILSTMALRGNGRRLSDGSIEMPDGQLDSAGKYAVPFRADFVAKTNSTNLRISFGRGQLIFNWAGHLETRQLRFTDPAKGPDRVLEFNDKGSIPPNEFVRITWIVDEHSTSIFVNGEQRALVAGEYAALSDRLSIYPREGSVVTVKSVSVSQGNVAPTPAPAPVPADSPPASGNIFADGPAPAGAAGLTAQLNDPAHWVVQKGTWHNAANKLRGEGESEIWSDVRLPRNVALSFRMNVIEGGDPRMDFYPADIRLNNIGAGQNLFPVLGPTAKLTTPPDGYIGTTRVGISYANNQLRLMTFKFGADRFAVEVDGKPTYAGTYAPGADIRLQFHGGGKHGGITEYSDFKVESLTSSPIAPVATPSNPAAPAPGP